VTQTPGAARGSRRAAAITLGVALIATFGALAVAQRLKHAPPLAYTVHGGSLLSPNGDGNFDRVNFFFKLRRSDTGTILVVNSSGDPVRTLQKNVHITHDHQVSGSWDGSDHSGKIAPDGLYRIQVVLQHAGRSVQLPLAINLDTTAPTPKLLSIGPEKSGPVPRPELFPNSDGKPLLARFRLLGCAPAVKVPNASTRKTSCLKPGIAVFRTDLARPRMILDTPIAPGQTSWSWDGTVHGKRVAQGTYVVAVHVLDPAYNEGWSTGAFPPVAAYGAQLRGQGGVVVRYLASQTPESAVAAGSRAVIGVISPGHSYDWSLRRVGDKSSRSRGKSSDPLLRPKLPGGPSGMYVLSLRNKGRTAQSFVLTQAAKKQKVLVVVPQTTLVGAQQVDDNGDGSPDTLVRGIGIDTGRVPVDAALPSDVSDNIAPLLESLDRKHRQYDLTTDLALARGTGPTLAGHTGVILAGKASFVDTQLQRRIVSWVRRGGRLWIAEPGSLLRGVHVTATQAQQPTPASERDPFGFELAPLQRVSGVDQASDKAGLLKGTDGQFAGPLLVEPILKRPSGSLLTEATTSGAGQSVFVAVQVGRGAVIRSGISGLGALSLTNADAREFLRSTWIYLGGGK
jgi:hypothetical protein